ncbi:hypothetical protein NC661_16985 [Aquibacillus koreensis]|uniref:Uncharacterized protein n=2 Tax=Aquibacillus koreensis TaxID=279446 RepID=A0A9X3WQZ3_9BACI|nr:hypothetical protein [Aquibacillus koreensis]MCT2536131.1 hypothetical protein [Aquibacillus koreensis]MDC3422056.1 hypothetical protein [Aquibacillus koreensis]
MVTSLYLVSLTILLTFLVLAFVEKISTRRKKLSVDINFDAGVQVQPVMAKTIR